MQALAASLQVGLSTTGKEPLDLLFQLYIMNTALRCIIILIIYMKKFLDSDWLRGVQF